MERSSDFELKERDEANMVEAYHSSYLLPQQWNDGHSRPLPFDLLVDHPEEGNYGSSQEEGNTRPIMQQFQELLAQNSVAHLKAIPFLSLRDTINEDIKRG
ncbi:hypothetical protein GOBAR_AA10030 [Gossypium barbadense]|uniref:Uncharacterized protein n=1 Tax=Gossypium barbadense TaxID=3634 RepID=A0A2P5Y4R4_GOSBA|nr:hypothetical protein GOBAR_AA10030 [Gossypium barbadense]